MMTKIHWYVRNGYSSYVIQNDVDDRCYECDSMANAAWLVGLLNKLENEKNMITVTESLIIKWKQAASEAMEQGVSPVNGCHKVCLEYLGVDENHPNVHQMVDDLEDRIFQAVLVER